MIRKILVCDACGKEESWDNAYPGGRPAASSIELFDFHYQHLCVDCVNKAVRVLTKIFQQAREERNEKI